MAEVWERRTGEGAKPYFAFKLYCEMEAERSYRKVAEELGKSETLIARWGRKYNWQERVVEYDRYVEKRRMDRNISERTRMAERHAEQAQLMQRKCLEALNLLHGKDLKPSEIARLFEVATRAEIRARGEPRDEQVASINVHVRLQERPRYAEESTEASSG